MTFTEAAVEVLRLTGKPLHYKKITEIAIEKNLLSHVGKTPETTMSARLATMVKKDRGDAPILKVKPGVFALREFSEDAPDEGADEESSEQSVEASDDKAADPKTDDKKADDKKADVKKKARALPGSDVFPEEDDDDDLILANLDDDASERSRRSNRRRGGRRKRADRDEARTDDKRSSSSSSRSRRSSPRKQVSGDWNRKPADGDAVGGELADAIEKALSAGRSRQGQSHQAIAERLVRDGRLSGNAEDLAPTVAAAVRGDNARRSSAGGRPRFAERGAEVCLTRWDLSASAYRAEQDAIKSAARQTQAVRADFIKRVRSLPDAGLIELLATWLNALGVTSIRAVQAQVGEFDLAGTLKQGPQSIPLAIAIFKGKQAVGRDQVLGVRGAAHHFGQAQAAWLITLGQAKPDAHAETQSQGAMPVAIFDGDALAESMQQAGVGLRQVQLPLAELDVTLLDSLGGGPSQSASSDDERPSRRRRGGRRRTRGRGERTEEAADSKETPADDDNASTDEAKASADAAPEQPIDVEAPTEAIDVPEQVAQPAVES